MIRRCMVYECGVCSRYHPWEWSGDCRDNAHRYADLKEVAARQRVPVSHVDVLSWEDRCRADGEGV